MRRGIGIGLMLCGGCASSVQLQGTVYESRARDAGPLAGAEVTIVDRTNGNRLAQTQTDDAGFFFVEVPELKEIAAEIRGPGLATTTFTGTSGALQVVELEERTLFGVSLEEVQAERELFAGCPGADGTGAVVFGEMRVEGIVDPYSGESPTTNAGRVDLRRLLEDATEVVAEGCYLDDEGVGYDPSASFTGATARFAVFGPAPGEYQLEARYQPFPNEWLGSVFAIWVPEGDEQVATALWPAWVPLFL
ncbi:MAG: hypothetical protein KTR31_24880 [Myxococcales bacterium]|nr:hypothetical protein [Myxococcales bacterium]